MEDFNKGQRSEPTYDEVHERLKPHLGELADRLSGNGNGAREDPHKVLADFSKKIDYPIGYLELISHLNIYFDEQERESRPRPSNDDEDHLNLTKRIKGDWRSLEQSQTPSRLDDYLNPDIYE